MKQNSSGYHYVPTKLADSGSWINYNIMVIARKNAPFTEIILDVHATMHVHGDLRIFRIRMHCVHAGSASMYLHMC